jgi:phosphoribosyl-AMP cyclohydrolase
MSAPAWIDQVKFDAQGLVTAVAQDAGDGTVLMVAHMNREALLETARTGRGVYWSRSRNKLWRKGEESGNVQEVEELLLDCDRDAVLLKVRQKGGAACHTGHRSCFHSRAAADGSLEVQGKPVFDPAKVYKGK